MCNQPHAHNMLYSSTEPLITSAIFAILGGVMAAVAAGVSAFMLLDAVLGHPLPNKFLPTVCLATGATACEWSCRLLSWTIVGLVMCISLYLKRDVCKFKHIYRPVQNKPDPPCL